MSHGLFQQMRAISQQAALMSFGKFLPKTRYASFVDDNFPRQKAYILDESKLVAAQCTRRAGKTSGFAKKALRIALNEPGTYQIYMALTLDSAKEIIWSVLEDECDKAKVPYNPHRSIGVFELDNGSRIRLFGVDSSYREMKKILGQKIRGVGVDEAGSMTIDMVTLCYKMIIPALTDLGGYLHLFGTCENIPNTFFQKITDGKEAGWNIHKWTTYDNPYMADKWEAEIKRILANDPNASHTSWFKNHYLNQWCADDDLLIYKIDERINIVDDIPKQDWSYVLGVDLGYNDDSAFVIGCYSHKYPSMFIVDTFKSKELDFTQVAQVIKNFRDKYPIYKIIVDGANKQGVMEIQNRHGITLESAEKKDKSTYMRILRDDLLQGRVKMLDGKCQPLLDELGSLQWENDERQNEDPRCNNHLSDALLYLHRFCYNYVYKPEEKICLTDHQRMQNQMQKEIEEMQKQDEENQVPLSEMDDSMDLLGL